MEVVTCPGCLERDKRIAALERRVAELEALLRDLLDRLGANATNSGIPPSANPPLAPKPVTKKRTGKAPGGQPGHPPHLRRRLPPERLLSFFGKERQRWVVLRNQRSADPGSPRC
jgi:transposase